MEMDNDSEQRLCAIEKAIGALIAIQQPLFCALSEVNPDAEPALVKAFDVLNEVLVETGQYMKGNKGLNPTNHYLGRDMKTLDLLLIRACKSKRPYQRLLSVHRRYWLVISKPDTDKCLALKLGSIVQKYCPIGLGDMVDGLNPSNRWRLNLDSESGYMESVWRLLAQHIRQTKVDCFPEYPIPAKWKDAA